jgi:long-chain acyl-CoA synthetase
MYPGAHAQTTPDKPAVIMAGSGETVTYAELDARSNQLAHYWRSIGLGPGDHVAILSENHPMFHVVYWAAIRSGLHLTAVNRYLSAEECAYIVNDSGSKSLVTTAAMADTVAAMAGAIDGCTDRLMLDGTIDGFTAYDDAVASMPTTKLDEEPLGNIMLYSSGTTGQPKGIKRSLSGTMVDDPANAGISMLERFLLGMDETSIYLSPAPLYHAAPLAWSAGVHELGATVVVMEKFDAVAYLEAVEKFSVTHSQLVPTMFVRMLKLPEDVRTGFDVSSLQCVVHAAAPCPVEVKRLMMDWWGPIVTEYYAGTEGNGLTFINAEEWLAHPGSVGKAVMGTIHICDEAGAEQPTGEPGIVYFEQETMPFEYHGDPEKTRAAQHPAHPNWSALGDVGYVDAEGYLYLTDRKAFMIISGGVNIYPQEVEDVLVVHEAVADCAVFGLPDPEMGEFVQAVVQVADGVEPTPELAEELRAYLREHIAHYKVPRVIDFRPELPRLPTGKLYKRHLRDEYLAGAG